MRWYLPLVPLLGQSVLAADQPPRQPPTVDLTDPRFRDYKPPGPGDSRGPCPVLNSLANHGFLPHDGKNINIVDMIVGLFLGLGVSPEASAIAFAFGLASSSTPLTLSLSLEDLSRHLFVIEHDCSFSRHDKLVGDNTSFNRTLWNVALKSLEESQVVTPTRMGRAKGIRVEDNKRYNPNTVYGPRAAIFGAMEGAALAMVLSDRVPGFSKLEYIRSVFEEERLPYHLGWRPIPLFTNLLSVVVATVPTLAADPYPVSHGIGALLGTPSDLLQTILPPNLDFIPEVTKIITDIGFDPSIMDDFNRLIGYTPPRSG